jgi:hypothetical protein
MCARELPQRAFAHRFAGSPHGGHTTQEQARGERSLGLLDDGGQSQRFPTITSQRLLDEDRLADANSNTADTAPSP